MRNAAKKKAPYLQKITKGKRGKKNMTFYIGECDETGHPVLDACPKCGRMMTQSRLLLHRGKCGKRKP